MTVYAPIKISCRTRSPYHRTISRIITNRMRTSLRLHLKRLQQRNQQNGKYTQQVLIQKTSAETGDVVAKIHFGSPWAMNLARATDLRVKQTIQTHSLLWQLVIVDDFARFADAAGHPWRIVL